MICTAARACVALIATAVLASGAHAQADAQASAQYRACLERTKLQPDEAFDEALRWRDEGGGSAAEHCIAMALLELGNLEEAAARLEGIARAPDAGEAVHRAEILGQAGNAWLLANAPFEAERVFSDGLKIRPGDPDLLLDRARALAIQDRGDDAIRDLSQALLVRPNDPLALRLRADAYLLLGALEAAAEDVRTALSLAPSEVETLLVRGRVREAQRLAGVTQME